MLASWNWLKSLLHGEVNPERAAARLTSAGLQIESVTRLGEAFSGVVVAEVVSQRAHPRADKLTLVTIRDDRETVEVVCGASNVPAPGGRVLWARPGARLPGGREIAVRAVQGVSSPGMLCSEQELGISDSGAGIVIVDPVDAEGPLGAAAQDALDLRDTVLDVNVPPNRPDCLGHLGLAREVAALFGLGLRRPDVALDKLLVEPAAGERVSVQIDDPVACPRYTARLIEGLKIGPSPRWLRRRLEAVGLRPINNLVDVTNYVMLELGQPLHAFNFERIRGGKIVVRRARAGERMTTLDGNERVLAPEDVLICDGEGPVALAGVMGGAGSEVSEGTTRVLLESATFDPRSIRRTARRLGLHSESSYRFERGVDPNGVDYASSRAASLYAELGGGRVLAGVVDAYPRRIQPAVVEVRPARVARLLGLSLSTDEIARHLRSIDLGVDSAQDLLVVTCPTYRIDLEREVDLIEEVARLHGFDDVPGTIFPSKSAPAASGDPLAERARDALVAAGLDETIGFGFTSRKRLELLRLPASHAARRPIAVKNPMQEEQAVLRTSLVPGLLAALARNLSVGVASVRLFELGHVFLRSGRPQPDEPRFVAGVIAGERPGWLKPAGAYDFYDAKGVVERLFADLRLAPELVPSRSEDSFLHPGAAAAIIVGGQHVGVVGEVHPETREAAGIERPCFAFEINLEVLPPLAPAAFTPLGRFPAVVRDVSFFVDDFVPAARVRELLLAERPEFLEEVRVLEDYREAGKVPAGKKGMLWSLTYRSDARTLTETEVDKVHEVIVARLLAGLRAERR